MQIIIWTMNIFFEFYRRNNMKKVFNHNDFSDLYGKKIRLYDFSNKPHDFSIVYINSTQDLQNLFFIVVDIANAMKTEKGREEIFYITTNNTLGFKRFHFDYITAIKGCLNFSDGQITAKFLKKYNYLAKINNSPSRTLKDFYNQNQNEKLFYDLLDLLVQNKNINLQVIKSMIKSNISDTMFLKNFESDFSEIFNDNENENSL